MLFKLSHRAKQKGSWRHPPHIFFNLCSIDEGFYNPPGCVISSRPCSSELECMVYWGKGAKVWGWMSGPSLPLALDQTCQGPRGVRGRLALEITTCDRQREEIQEDRNNQVRLHLESNMQHGSKRQPRPLISVRITRMLLEKHMHRLMRALAVFRSKCLWVWIGNDVTAGWFQAYFHTFEMRNACLDNHLVRLKHTKGKHDL